MYGYFFPIVSFLVSSSHETLVEKENRWFWWGLSCRISPGLVYSRGVICDVPGGIHRHLRYERYDISVPIRGMTTAGGVVNNVPGG